MKDLELKFNELIGVVCDYGSKKLKITDVKFSNGKLIVYSNKRTFALFESEAEKLYNELTPISDSESSDVDYLPVVSSKNSLDSYNNNADVITSALMNQLALISSSSNVSQAQLDKAKAMSQIANTMVNVEKVKLDYINLISK